MTRRISSSRPTTGSILPFRAASVRSRVYACRGPWNFRSGSRSVTRCAPRTEASAWRSFVANAARGLERAPHLAVVLRQCEMLHRHEVVLQRLPSSRLSHDFHRAARERGLSTTAILGSFWRWLVRLCFSLSPSPPALRKSGSAMPSSCSSIASMRCSGTISGLPRRLAMSEAGPEGLLALRGHAIRAHSSPLRCRRCRVGDPLTTIRARALQMVRRHRRRRTSRIG